MSAHFFLLLLHSAHSLLSDIFLLSLHPSLFLLHISISPHHFVQRKNIFVNVSFVTRQRGPLPMVICVGVHSKRVHMFTDAFKAASRLMNLFFFFLWIKAPENTWRMYVNVCLNVDVVRPCVALLAAPAVVMTQSEEMKDWLCFSGLQGELWLNWFSHNKWNCVYQLQGFRFFFF